MQTYVIACYIRLSVEDSKNDSMSIENQHMILHEYALSMPEAAQSEILDFVDNGYSGTNFERPQVQKLIELVRENKIDCILVKDFSRFGRNSIEMGYFIERVFPLFHTRFISVSDDFDSDHYKGTTGGMDVAFKYLISEFYSRDMSIKVKSAKYAKMQRGEYQSQICPYGYRKGESGRMEPDPEASNVVKLIFELAANGTNMADIAKELHRRGIPTPGEYKVARGCYATDVSRALGIWQTSTVLRILRDERYTGVYIAGRTGVPEIGSRISKPKDKSKWFVIPDHHPAIIDQELFAQAHIAWRERPVKKNRGVTDYLLKGKAICGCCKHTLSYAPLKRPYYFCRFSKADGTMDCHGLRIAASDLELTVYENLKAVADVLFAPNQDAATLGAIVSERPEYERQIEALEKEKMQLYENYLLGEIDVLTYKREKEAVNERLTAAKNAYAALVAQAKVNEEKQERLAKRKVIADALTAAESLTDRLIDLLIDKVYIHPGNRIEIAYKIPDFNV